MNDKYELFWDFHVNELPFDEQLTFNERVEKLWDLIDGTFEQLSALKCYVTSPIPESTAQSMVTLWKLEQELLETVKRCYNLASISDIKEIDKEIQKVRQEIPQSKLYNNFEKNCEEFEFSELQTLASLSERNLDEIVATPISTSISMSKEEIDRLDGIFHHTSEIDTPLSPVSSQLKNSKILVEQTLKINFTFDRSRQYPKFFPDKFSLNNLWLTRIFRIFK